MNTQTQDLERLRAERAYRLALDRALDRRSDKLYNDQTLTGLAEQSRKRLKDTQMRHLERLAYGTDRLADLFDYVKGQVGKDKEGKGWNKGGFGTSLLEALRKLDGEAKTVLTTVRQDSGHQGPEDALRQIHLALCREYVRHLTAHYFYGEAISGG